MFFGKWEQDKKFSVICLINQGMYYFANLAVVGYTICYLFDFYLTIKHPLISSNHR